MVGGVVFVVLGVEVLVGVAGRWSWWRWEWGGGKVVVVVEVEVEVVGIVMVRTVPSGHSLTCTCWIGHCH